MVKTEACVVQTKQKGNYFLEYFLRYAIYFLKKRQSIFMVGVSPNLTEMHALHLAILKCEAV